MADSLRRVISRRFSLWQKAVALAPVLLLLVYLPGETMLRCRIDGLLRPACCCPPKAEAASAGPVVKAADCCNAEVAQSTRPAAEAVRPASRDLVQVATAAIVARVASVPRVTDRTARSRLAETRSCARRPAPRSPQARVPDLRRTGNVGER